MLEILLYPELLLQWMMANPHLIVTVTYVKFLLGSLTY